MVFLDYTSLSTVKSNQVNIYDLSIQICKLEVVDPGKGGSNNFSKVGVDGLEPSTSASQTRRATNCATPRANVRLAQSSIISIQVIVKDSDKSEVE